MKKIFLILVILIFAQCTFACDATLYPRKDYIVITQNPIKILKIEDENILSGQIIATLFSAKNQLILKPKNIGKTKLFLNDKTYRIEVSKEQKEEWNILDVNCLEIDNPPINKGAQND